MTRFGASGRSEERCGDLRRGHGTGDRRDDGAVWHRRRTLQHLPMVMVYSSSCAAPDVHFVEQGHQQGRREQAAMATLLVAQ